MNDWMKDDKIKDILLDDRSINRNLFKKKEVEKLFNFKNNINDPATIFLVPKNLDVNQH